MVIPTCSFMSTGTHQEAKKIETTMFRVENAKEVVLENLVIIQGDGDFRSWDTIRIEGADRVTVRNVYLAGSTQSYHLRLEGVKDIFIDNVEVAGVDYSKDGQYTCGGGIWINHGTNSGTAGIQHEFEGKMVGTGIFTPYARHPGWMVIQNSYFHDHSKEMPKYKNHDAILIMSHGDMAVFNNVFERWYQPPGDSAIDISYRRKEPEHQNKFARVERNIIRNATFYKHPGSSRVNGIMFANNLFINTAMADYHGGENNDVTYLHNTHIFDMTLVPPQLRDHSGAARSVTTMANLWAFQVKPISGTPCFMPLKRR
ncbi:MAG: hypothetical protein HC898_00210 [Phycisphaerales bacterium]|nr:hypothetical protein [Phycisphaerales bacterium]